MLHRSIVSGACSHAHLNFHTSIEAPGTRISKCRGVTKKIGEQYGFGRGRRNACFYHKELACSSQFFKERYPSFFLSKISKNRNFFKAGYPIPNQQPPDRLSEEWCHRSSRNKFQNAGDSQRGYRTVPRLRYSHVEARFWWQGFVKYVPTDHCITK